MKVTKTTHFCATSKKKRPGGKIQRISELTSLGVFLNRQYQLLTQFREWTSQEMCNFRVWRVGGKKKIIIHTYQTVDDDVVEHMGLEPMTSTLPV